MERNINKKDPVDRLVSFVRNMSIATIIISILLGIGYIANIVKIFLLDWTDPATIEFIIRAVGVFVFPIGMIVGYF